jgi:MYXO-CTERM domain-containing protein
LDTAVDISADGRVIVGDGYHISAGRNEGWIATIPEPSALTGLLTLGGALLLAHLRRRKRPFAKGNGR